MQSPFAATPRHVFWGANATSTDPICLFSFQSNPPLWFIAALYVNFSANFRMFAFFKSAKPQPSAPATAEAPELKEAQLAAAIYGQRTRGDLHDYIRVSPSRVLFALLDVA